MSTILSHGRPTAIRDLEDLARARSVQRQLVPEALPQVPGYDLAAYYAACQEVGGDYFDVFPLDGHRVGLVIADAVGKGVAGAMMMVLFRSALRLLAPRFPSPRELMIAVNRSIVGDLRPGQFVTALYVIVDVRSHVATFCCCGHEPPVLVREGRSEIHLLPPSGVPLGVYADAGFQGRVQEYELDFAPGDRLFLCTDGLTEAMNPAGECYGKRRLLDVLARHHHSSGNDILHRLLTDLARHEAGAARHDDLTMFTFRLLPDSRAVGTSAA